MNSSWPSFCHLLRSVAVRSWLKLVRYSLASLGDRLYKSNAAASISGISEMYEPSKPLCKPSGHDHVLVPGVNPV